MNPLKHLRSAFVALVIALSISAAHIAPAAAGSMTDYLENKLIDHLFRSTSFTAPATIAVGLIVVNKGYWAASTGYANGDYVIPLTPNGRLYKQTSGGACTSNGSAPTWGTTAGGNTTDNTCTWTEQTTAFEAGTWPEVANAGNYARVTLNPSTSNWANTQASGTTASSGTSGTTSNSSAITFGAPSANWGVIFGFTLADSATYGSGNTLVVQALTTPKTVNNGDSAPSFGIGSLTFQIDN